MSTPKVIAMNSHNIILSEILLFLLLPTKSSLAHVEGLKNVISRDIDRIERDDNPETVEEDEEQPLVHPVAGVEVDVTRQPLRHESHVAYETGEHDIMYS